MAAKTDETGTTIDSTGAHVPYGMVGNETASPQVSFSGEEGEADSTGTMPPVSNVDPGGCQ